MFSFPVQNNSDGIADKDINNPDGGQIMNILLWKMHMLTFRKQ